MPKARIVALASSVGSLGDLLHAPSSGMQKAQRATMRHNLHNTLQEFAFGGKPCQFYSLQALEKAGLGKISRMPISLRVVLESALRNFDYCRGGASYLFCGVC